MHTETAVILAHLPPDTEITVTVKLRDWLAAKAATTGGPEYTDAAEAARVLGFSATYWGRRAKEGKITGAVQDESSRWRLPLEACRAHIRGLRRKPTPANARPTLVTEYKPRGPRKPYQAKQATSA